MKIYPHPSDGKPVLGAVVFLHRGYEISLSNLFGAGEIRIFDTRNAHYDVTKLFCGHLYVPTANGIRDIVEDIDAHLDEQEEMGNNS